jgi:hypothetical protein
MEGLYNCIGWGDCGLHGVFVHENTVSDRLWVRVALTNMQYVW